MAVETHYVVMLRKAGRAGVKKAVFATIAYLGILTEQRCGLL